jgi:hypothetical protein
MKSDIFWMWRSVVWYKLTDVPHKGTASDFKVKAHVHQANTPVALNGTE